MIAAAPERYQVEALTAQHNVEALARAARQHGARLAVLADPAGYGALVEALAGSGIEAAAGPAALVEAAARPADWVMAAVVGAAGLRPTLAAVERGAMVALANKECLVCAGAVMLERVRASGAVLLPVDSEHNAIFQALRDEPVSAVERLILTASGGPFRQASIATMAAATPAAAIAHPNWSMGAKISVDSATMMNKGLELIEAHHLFGVPEPALEVVVHPESIVHSLVAFKDGSMLAQLGQPDMRIPIAHALGWPDRISAATPRLDLVEVGRLTFEPPDPIRFPALQLARAALAAGGMAATVLNAANEVAVAAFLAEQLGFLAIAAVVEATLAAYQPGPVEALDAIVAVDGEARRQAAEIIAARRL